MLSQNEIIAAMQYTRFNASDPLNTTDSARITISYQYAGNASPADLPTSAEYSGWRQFTAAEKADFEAALAHIESFLNVDFVQTTGNSDPDLNVAAISLPGSVIGHGGYSVRYQGSSILEWDGFVAYDTDLDLSLDRQFDLLLHELGHAMGLRHTHEADDTLPAEFDSNLYSVMSYRANPVNGEDSDAMMLFDVLALQDIWGAAPHNEGTSSYTGSRTRTVDSIWDSGGTDALDANGRRAGVTLDLRQGAFSSFDADQDVVVTFGTEIENAFGAQGADLVIGNELNNLLRGHADHDVLAGKAGRDRIEGGAGRDTLWGDEGVDLLFGGRGQDQLYGGSENDQLTGRNGADRLDGQAGDDLLLGGRGLDTFVFKHQGGNDTVEDFNTDADRLDIIGHGGLDALLDQAQDTDNGVLFDFDQGGSLLLRDVTLAGLGEDFLI